MTNHRLDLTPNKIKAVIITKKGVLPSRNQLNGNANSYQAIDKLPSCRLNTKLAFRQHTTNVAMTAKKVIRELL